MILSMLHQDQELELFADWAKLKPILHFAHNTNVYFRERQIWWVSIGQNIGSEQNGKHEHFERPVLVLKKFNRDMFLAVPLSTKLKNSQYHYTFTRNGTRYCANMSQIRVLSSKRLLRNIDTMDKIDFSGISSLHRSLV